jgi:hypothetical protein
MFSIYFFQSPLDPQPHPCQSRANQSSRWPPTIPSVLLLEFRLFLCHIDGFTPPRPSRFNSDLSFAGFYLEEVLNMNTELVSWSLPWASAIAVLFLVIIATSWSRSYFRLQHIPGPPFAAFSKLWQVQKTIGGRFHLDTVEVCEKYGTLPIPNQHRGHSS